MEGIFSTDFLDLGKDGVQAAVTTVKDAAEAFVCYSASYEAIPALNLIATPNGQDLEEHSEELIIFKKVRNKVKKNVDELLARS